ncbi:DNA-binding protein K10-like [Phlebotomus papatasi]|uniref:Uncharacterized protein n=1 Tax=Phlebotomus papatasi TaxID=29031 RepID=A0A1B0DK71_PHLPP|nr:DNA-binding protein K10-like [Phlebotomus papatasi]
MAAAKAQNQRRRMPQKQRNNMQKFKQGTQKRVMRPNMGAMGAMFNNNYNQASQMMDNPGYMDFNEPAIRPPMGVGGGNNQGGPPAKVQNKMGGGAGNMQQRKPGNRQMVQNQQNRRRQHMPPQRPQQGGGGGMGGGGGAGGNMGGGGGGGGGGWGNQQPRMPQTPPNMNQRPGPPGPPFRGGPMPPRMHPHPMGPSMPPFHPPPMNGRFMGFGPRPGPPMPPPMGNPWPPMPGMPRPMPGAMGPPRPLMGGGGGNRPNAGNVAGNRMRRQQQNNNQKTQRKPTKAKGKMKPGVTGKKPNNQPQNQYSLDKPWVTQEIKDQHQKKLDLQNQLKGNRNDELFAKFKSERDKFVALYDAAKAEYTNKGKQVSAAQ